MLTTLYLRRYVMRVEEALKIFGGNTFKSESDVDKRYRTLVKMHHPDNVSESKVDIGMLREAREVLRDYIKASSFVGMSGLCSNVTRKCYIVTFDKLIEIFRGEKVRPMVYNGGLYIPTDKLLSRDSLRHLTRYSESDYDLLVRVNMKVVMSSGREKICSGYFIYKDSDSVYNVNIDVEYYDDFVKKCVIFGKELRPLENVDNYVIAHVFNMRKVSVNIKLNKNTD